MTARLSETSLEDVGSKKNTSINDSTSTEKGGKIKVPVNEDFLFDVDVEKRELAPTYWLGPIYDVRRGSWFHQEGSNLRPCDENLAIQLEEGYLKVKPWRYENLAPPSSDNKPRSRPVSMDPPGRQDLRPDSKPRPARSISSEDINKDKEDEATSPNITAKFELQTQRLFGNYMNSVVTYQDATVAWLLTDDFLSRMSSTVYQRFAGGGHLGGMKVVRGFTEAVKSKEKKSEAGAESSTNNVEPALADPKDRGAEPKGSDEAATTREAEAAESDSEPRLLKLERQMSSLITSPEPEDPAKEEEAARKRDEDQFQKDYRDSDGDDQGREIEHLILVTHGIGQRLGLRMESINFIHDVNVLRKTLKSVYDNSPDLQALNNEVEKLPKNCRVQVLPVMWRHLLDFPKQSFKQNSKEQDLTDADAFGEDEKYPSLEDITVEGVPAIRNLISDLALDILLYQSAYREHISGIVQRECNRIYELFMQRNPKFNGKVSLIGHSLGSAILFDILCRQQSPLKLAPSLSRNRRHSRRGGSTQISDHTPDLALNFNVESFFCLGSPLGLYQMLKGRRIAGRSLPNAPASQSPMDPDAVDDPFLGAAANNGASANDEEILSITVSSPKCQQLFNIFHPADPIAYRIEPLISPAMSSLKAQPLPYTKKGIFGAPGAGITGIGARVGQSVSGLWSNFTSGVASSLLNRSLGLTGDGQLSSSQSVSNPQVLRAPTSSGAPASIPSSSSTVRSPDGAPKSDDTTDEHPPTLIDSEIETLYAGFQKRQRTQQSDNPLDPSESAAWAEFDERARRLRREEGKVRALNGNGRVDFSIQEGVFDISLIASIASHMSYWADEDVSHFMISQLLSRQRVMRR